MRPGFSALAGLLALAAGFAVLPAQAAPEHGATFKDWRAHCDPGKDGAEPWCHVFQNLVVTDTQQQLMHVMVLYTSKRPDPVMIITLPLGVALRPGLQVTVDDAKPIPVDFEACLPEGCRAGLLLDAKLLQAMQKGDKAVVGVFDLKGKQLNLPVSLSGFTQAVASLKH